ncbi:hypothetical protein [Mycobacterium sp. 1245805.9]|uniref:hypothetical protein n=1 Tax=Mycobacterium sp. 1245805.9 TaxID=1856862 RepID=UPI0012E99A2C|nr:hypothetical protein [Mycobacterium sp. 1245805.9]
MGEATVEFIAAVARETGVPEWLLTQGGNNTTEGIWERARQAVDWKYATAPQTPLPTAAVSVSLPYEPITPQRCVPDGDYLAAWRSGRLAPVGIPAPPPRCTGEGHRDAGP